MRISPRTSAAEHPLLRLPRGGDLARRVVVRTALALSLAALSACSSPRSIDDPEIPGCTRCHGGEPASGAASDAWRPGAHAAHVGDAALACGACHPDPASSGKHQSGRVDLEFGPVATRGGALEPSYSAGACASTYCHGGFPGGNGANAPAWTGEPSAAACGTCHGDPGSAIPPLPTAAHAALADGATVATCAVCHPDTVDASGAPLAGKHVDGTVQALDAARHPDGWTDPRAPEFHGRAAAEDVRACDRCHAARAPARVTAVVCAQCHDGLAGGGDWTTTCNTCHGSGASAAPPADVAGNLATTARGVGAHQAHVTAPSGISAPLGCEFCHRKPENAYDAGHLNGEVEVTGYTGPDGVWAAAVAAPGWDPGRESCATSYCHGGYAVGGTAAEPVWTRVGQGEASCGTCHALPPATHAGIGSELGACAGCHETTMDAGGALIPVASGGTHLDGVIEAKGGHDGAFKYEPASPSFHAFAANRGLANCQLCHGATLAGGLTGPSCLSCHGPSFTTSCGGCHGNRSTGAGAPPRGTWGRPTPPGDAHGAHLAGALGTSLDCSVCHRKPASAFDPGHVDASPAEVEFGGVAKAGGVTPAPFDRTTGTCSGVYCHGASLAGGSNPAPRWTGADQAACGACHGRPPPPPHVQNPACGSCHAGYTSASVDAAAHVDGSVDVAPMTCRSCHGSSANAAPPGGTAGETSPADRAVGAHQKHVATGSLSRPIACGECHVVPDATDHANGAVEIAFGALAGAQGAAPAWRPGEGTCASTYCHGATLGAGGLNHVPAWTGGSAEAACGSCHGLPPPSPHLQSSACGDCHPGYGSTTVNAATHVDGAVALGGLTCSSCHGSAANAAPPRGTGGETATTDRAVGAHQKHLSGGALGPAVACVECHVVPSSLIHASGAVEVEFGALARTKGATPAWSGEGLTCASTYCHGRSPAVGGTNRTPSWTGGSAEVTCGSCHGLPPPAPHVQNPSCGNCHGAGYSQAAVNVATHLDGDVDLVAMTCTSCHGSGASPAPPFGTGGETLTTDRAVGAHQKHLAGGAIGPAVACGECHVVPTSMTHASGTAEVTFGALARRDGAQPVWEGAALTCATTYCHGATLGAGGTTQRPRWTGGAGEAACGTCHGAPPPAPHSGNPACGNCHPGYGSSTVDLAIHLDGTVQVNDMTCRSCHGSAESEAPPYGTRGETLTAERAVGAHQAHVTGATLGQPVACEECHLVPSSMGHSDGVALVRLEGRALQDGAAPLWNGETCTSTYCHGATLGAQGSATAPEWTRVDGTQAGCGACHGAPPPAPHTPSPDCGRCHPGYGASAVNPALHLDGDLDVSPMTCTSCHGDPARATNAAAPPTGTRGETSPGTRAVGAHAVHLSGGAVSSGFACAECHASPASMAHANGTVELAFGARATAAGAAPAWNGAGCAATYCHGTTLASGGTVLEPAWTGGAAQAACGACHAIPNPDSTHNPHRRMTCDGCHGPGYSRTTVNKATHVDGILQRPSCESCHSGEE